MALNMKGVIPQTNGSSAPGLKSSKRPKAGSLTERVWAIADDFVKKTGKMPTSKEVVTEYAKQGGKEGTGSVQYSHWKHEYMQRRNGIEFRDAKTVDTISSVKLNIEPNGRFVIPKEFRSGMKLDGSGTVTAKLVDGELRIISPQAAILKSQKKLKPLKRDGESIVDEFLAERRAMWGEE